ncbi:MAG: class I SAM-dependent methyltransferase [Solirubrobacteraceae bacterium]
MQGSEIRFDPYLNDPLRWGASMVHHSELMLRCLEIAQARSVVEVGAFAGDLTRVLTAWAQRSGASVVAVDPCPQEQLVALAAEQANLELVRDTSLEALPRLAQAEAIVIDGDHNYYTVSEELRLICQAAPEGATPLLLFHDVCWPHARRDDYFDPALIPPDRRWPTVSDGAGITPGDPSSTVTGLPYPGSAAHEGGPRNGVLTAVEDFVTGHESLRLVVISAFFGFGVVWHASAPWADALADLLEPWDRSELLERLEANRVGHIAGEHALRVELWRLQERQSRQERVLNRLLESSAFRVAERLSSLRVRAGIAPAQSVISRGEIRRALDG